MKGNDLVDYLGRWPPDRRRLSPVWRHRVGSTAAPRRYHQHHGGKAFDANATYSFAIPSFSAAGRTNVRHQHHQCWSVDAGVLKGTWSPNGDPRCRLSTGGEVTFISNSVSPANTNNCGPDVTGN